MNESSDYVFKSSKVVAELAIQMDVEGPENIVQEEMPTLMLPIQGSMDLNIRFMAIPPHHEKSHQISKHGPKNREQQRHNTIFHPLQ